MKKLMIAVSALTLTFGASLLRAADDSTQPSGTANPGITNNAPGNNPTANPMGAQAAQTPPANWTSLKGTVQAVDTTAKTLQIKDDTGNLIQVPVDRQVSIQKDGKRVKLAQVQTGDIIVLAKRNVSSQEESPKAY